MAGMRSKPSATRAFRMPLKSCLTKTRVRRSRGSPASPPYAARSISQPTVNQKAATVKTRLPNWR